MVTLVQLLVQGCIESVTGYFIICMVLLVGTMMFHFRKRPNDTKKTKHKKLRAVSHEELRTKPEESPMKLPYLLELNPGQSQQQVSLEIVVSPLVHKNSVWSFELPGKVIPILVLIFCGFDLQMALTTLKGRCIDWAWTTQRSAVTPPWRSRSVPGSMVMSLRQPSQRFWWCHWDNNLLLSLWC